MIKESLNLSGTVISKEQDKLMLKLERLQDEIKLEVNVDVKVENSKGEHYTFSFADLKKVTETIKPFLRKEGLVIWQVLEGLGVRTTLVDKESGQWISALASIPVFEQKNIQYYGSVFTYLRRYSLTTMLGLVNDADDDANEADGNKADRKVDGKPALTFEVFTRMIAEVEKGNWKDVERQIGKYYLTDSQKGSLTTLLNQKKAELTLNKIA